MDPWKQLSNDHKKETSELFEKHRQERWELRRQEYLKEKLSNSKKEDFYVGPPSPLGREEIKELLHQQEQDVYVELEVEGRLRRRLTKEEKEHIHLVGMMANNEARKRKRLTEAHAEWKAWDEHAKHK